MPGHGIAFDPTTYRILGTRLVVADPALNPVDPAAAGALGGIRPGNMRNGVAIRRSSVCDSAPGVPEDEWVCDRPS